jgi:predicted ATPase
MRIARETGDPEILLQAHHCAWPTHFHSGRFKASVDHIDAGALIYDEVRYAHHRHLYLAHDPGVCMQYFKGPAHVLLGHPDQGLRSAEDGVALARRLGHPLSLAIALWGHCHVVARRGDAAAILCSARELVSQTDAYGLPMQRAAGLVFLGWGLCGSGNAEEGLARQREGLDLMTGLDGQLYLTLLNSQLADSLLAAGRYSDGLAVVARAFDTLVRTGEHSYLSRLHGLRGELLVHANGSADEAGERELRQALAVAREQDAKGWELGAATSLVRLWGERGRRAEAYDLLAPVYGWFTEGFDTADLKQSKALLDELR